MNIKTIFKNKIGHKIFYTWWFIIPVLPGIHDCGIAFAAVGTRACSNVTIFDNRCCFVCSFAVPWINVNWVVLSWDRCDFKSIAWTYFTILERFTNLLTIFKGYRVHIIGTIPLFQVRIEIIINKSIRKTVSSHLLPVSCLGDDINCTNCINYWGWIWNFWSVLSNYCAISNILIILSLLFSCHHFLPLWLLPSFFGDEFVDDAHLAAAPELAFIMDAAIKL